MPGQVVLIVPLDDANGASVTITCHLDLQRSPVEQVNECAYVEVLRVDVIDGAVNGHGGHDDCPGGDVLRLLAGRVFGAAREQQRTVPRLLGMDQSHRKILPL